MAPLSTLKGFDGSARLAAALCALLGGGLLVAWLEGGFDGVARTSLPHFDTALGLLLAGAAVWCLSRRRRLAAALCMLPPVVLAADALIQHLLEVDLPELPLGPDGRGGMPLISALALLLTALGLLCQRRPLLMGLCGVATWGIGLASVLAAVFGFAHRPLLLGHGLVALETSAGLLLLGGSVFALGAAWGWRGPSASSRWVLLPLAVAGLTVVLSLWQALRVQQELALQQAVVEEVGAVAEGFEALTRPHVQALVRMASRWRHRGGMPRDEWLADARLYVEHQPAYQALGWADNEGRVRWVAPLAGNEPAIDFPLTKEPRRRAALEKARATGRESVSRRVELTRGGEGFLIVLPMYAGDRPDGFVVGAIRIEPLMNAVLSKLSAAKVVSAVGLQVLDGDEPIFEQARETLRAGVPQAERALSFGDRTWRLRLWATPEFLAARHSSLPTAVLIMGLVLTGLLLLVMRFWLDARGRAAELGHEVVVRQRAEGALQRARDELERRVNERTAELSASNDRLRRSQQALQESEERLAVALKAGNVGTWSWQLPEDRFEMDPTSLSLLGLPPARLPGGYGRFEAAVEPQQRPAVQRVLKAALARGEEFYAEFRAIGGDGHARSLAMRGQAFQEAGQQRLVGVLWDITERKVQEEVLRQYAAELKLSNQELEEFGYIASHDLKEPLRMMASYSELLARRYGGQLDEQARTFIDFIVDGATRMSRLLDDMLSYSRAGRLDQPRVAVDTRALVERIISSLGAAMAESPGSRVSHEGLPVVLAHETPLHQVFQNLIANGLKFRRDEPPRVHVSAERLQGQWLFRVADNGIGIEAQQAERIFKIFQRLHSREQYPGTGVGLAVVKKIIERYGGQIWVDSRPGAGATFCFTLPDAAEAGGPPESEPPLATAS